MLDFVTDKKHDETRQGEAFKTFVDEPNQYKKLFYIESYGCQMNFADSEIVASILNETALAPPEILRKPILFWLIPVLSGKRQNKQFEND